jgi:uncharacterized membrane protein YphA (DoxX/SURF4 family)
MIREIATPILAGVANDDSQAVVLVLRVGIGLVLLMAAVGKLHDFSGFVHAVERFGSPRILAAPVSVVIIATEATVGALLLAGRSPAVPAVLATGLFATFACAIVVNLVNHTTNACHCFGSDAEPTGVVSLVRSLLLVACAAIVVLLGDQSASAVKISMATVPVWMLGFAYAFVVRSMSLVPIALTYLRQPPTYPDPTRWTRVSFKGHSSSSAFQVDSVGHGYAFAVNTADGDTHDVGLERDES